MSTPKVALTTLTRRVVVTLTAATLLIVAPGAVYADDTAPTTVPIVETAEPAPTPEIDAEPVIPSPGTAETAPPAAQTAHAGGM